MTPAPDAGSADPELEATLAATEREVADAEARLAERDDWAQAARGCLEQLKRRRVRVQQRGVHLVESGARSAVRSLIVATGCSALITGAAALDERAGAVALVASFVLIVYESLR